ncbi:uncharacterized protein YpmS [Geomicrobium halophilum]|uniref:Uncharacterized protein YpmS n=1 Tax=Geomicrobium halophilum TaxID=549000 RepID=A0A841PKZ7_9BACL|nr:YpmS family protein [Geomicrobium halophilum]MBB6449537.1 uncharacterized protein YpmS [Geomicrobium halophilum]
MNWKWAFFILLAINVIIAGSFWLLLSPIGSDSPSPSEIQEAPEEGEVFFSAETSIDQINTYLSTENDGFRIQKEGDEFVFTGTFEFFGVNFDVDLYLLPMVTDSGNLRLEENGVAIGALELPGSTVLEVIRQQADMPEWVHIYPDEGVIDVDINDIDIGDELYLRIGSLDTETITFEGVHEGDIS